ncbi:S8 family serine peptidase [Micromonospora sp. NPDC000207]|uniref:S8 family serine peptidase n=1 Tax=Micromonospora sp. NPDC000207 TaxID=3154246 RepID=UPI00332591CF
MRPTIARLLVLVVMAGSAVLVGLRPSSATAAPDAQAYVKYYVVKARHEGQPENLTEIARRFLGSGERSSEIYHLNTGRVQPDGARLTDPAKLKAGWALVLPWDAAGEGVKYGQLPGTESSPSPTPRPSNTSRPDPRPSAESPSPTPTRTSPSPTPSSSPSPRPSGSSEDCSATTGSSSQSDWAQLRMAADSAWTLTRGNGVKVAVIDTGVDASLQQLSGRVAVGADVTVGNGRGDTDCLGTGTAMAGIIAADNSTDGTPVGIAPDATILPVRMVRSSGNARAADAANAIEVAVSAGASVVAVGAYVDLGDPAVIASIATALNHDVLVVAPAPTKPVTLPTPSERAGSGALLLTGGVGAGDQLADKYAEGTVEVVAPGVDVASLGVGDGKVLSKTGSEYAVAFVAGQAALIRAAYPDLTAAQVEERIQKTADAIGGEAPSPQFGAGMINPAASVAKSTGDQNPLAAEQGEESGGTGTIMLVILGFMLVIGAGGMIAILLRRRLAG